MPLETQFITAPDGARIAYDVTGSGPAVLLLHGYGNNRMIWHEFGWAAQLGADFTVIAVDLRGCGASSGFDDPARYGAAAHLDDLRQVAAACGADRFAVVGYSWGGT
ncbi:MAG: alpha/beta fold hydrolase, partial [Anaerolineae bacterium]|nr:alpha/beta fold hydrolase [Anaerolineae bacterium]